MTRTQLAKLSDRDYRAYQLQFLAMFYAERAMNDATWSLDRIEAQTWAAHYSASARFLLEITD